MKSFIKTIMVIFFLDIMCCCINDSNNTAQICNDLFDTLNIDTTSNDTDTTLKVSANQTDTLPNNCSAQEAIIFLQNSDNWDKYSEGIIPDIINQHLPYARKLIKSTFDHFIIVDKGAMMVILYDKYGRRKLNFKMACGKNYGHKSKKADSRTPEGYFTCGGKYDSTDWLYTDDWGYTSPIKGQFGPRFIRVAPQIGIHGTNARWSIGRRCSHGCIRIQNEQILYLFNFAEKGMPIIVNPGPKDDAVNKHEGHNIPMLIIPDVEVKYPSDFEKFKEKLAKEKALEDSLNDANKKLSDTIKIIEHDTTLIKSAADSTIANSISDSTTNIDVNKTVVKQNDTIIYPEKIDSIL